MKTEKKCETCGNTMMDSTWGENKCEIHKRLVRHLDDVDDCEYYNENDKNSEQ